MKTYLLIILALVYSEQLFSQNKSKKYNNTLMSDGFFMDLLLRHPSSKDINSKNRALNFGGLIGVKKYLNKSKRYRIGIASTILKADYSIFYTPNNIINWNVISVTTPSFGISNIATLSKNVGLEWNVYLGATNTLFLDDNAIYRNYNYNEMQNFQDFSLYHAGLNLNPNIKLVYKSFTVGIDLDYTRYLYSKEETHYNNFSDMTYSTNELNSMLKVGLTLGVKY